MMSIPRVSSLYAASSSFSSSWKYDVFLSFRGEDTRNNFTSHLYAALDREGINVFRDDKELERGKSISPELFQAIEGSRFFIVVFSKNYASSTWCLEELVKIAECINNARGQTVIPVFYDVDPSIVRKQKETFQVAFAKHEETFKENMDKVQKWREALQKVTNISGWDAKHRQESEFIQDIVNEISSKISFSTCMNVKNLVGLDSCLEELRRLIDVGSTNVRMIGIWGMGGIGKTTIARVVYDLISLEFEGCSFLSNVREISEKGDMISLQKQLLYQTLRGTEIKIWDVNQGANEIRKRLQCKKVLVVIDDVAHVNQLKELAGEHEWFGLGSRIVITTRDEHLLRGVDQVYQAKLLNDDDALRLFSLKAFKNHQPPNEYLELCKIIVKYTGGLPLALEVLGSFLYGRNNVDDWKSTIERLNTDSEKEIIDKLQISFDGLRETEKKIFLDVACFFKGKPRGYVTRILDACGFNSTIGISVLVEKSLINILEFQELSMHDLIQEMGRQIVKRESQEPGKRSRLWEKADAHHVMRENTGTEVIECIMIEDELNLSVSAKAFSKMINLRLLKIKNVQLPEGLEYLSNSLRLLEWHGYPFKSLPSSLQLDEIVELNLYSSRIEQVWKGIKPLHTLTSVKLNNCQNLIEVPDLTWFPNLENLYVDGCPRLREIRSPLLVHKKLIYLQVLNCTSLTTLPSKIYMESLEELKILDCPKLKNCPEIDGSMKCISNLFIIGSAIKHLPQSVEHLTGLQRLVLTHNNNLVSLPNTINGLKSLKFLDLFGCSKLENVPETLAQVDSLEELRLDGTAITQPTSSIFLMKNLERLSFHGCKASSSKPWFLQLHVNVLPRRSSDVIALNSLMLPSLSGLCSIRRLDLSDCNLGEGAVPSDIFANLFSLENLDLSRNNFVSLPATINSLLKLKSIILNDCKRLQSLPELPSSTSHVEVNGCASLETLSNGLKSYDSGQLAIYCLSCFKLFPSNSWMFSILRDFVKATSSPRENFVVLAPGSEIPKWFRYQSEDSSISIERPPDLYDNKLVGYVACCVFGDPTQSRFNYTTDVKIRTRIDGGFSWVPHIALIDIKSKHDILKEEYLWLTCCFLEGLYRSKHIEFVFILSNDQVVMKKCGVHLIYEKDIKDFNPMNNKSSSPTFQDLDEFPQDSIGSMTYVSTAKRSLAGDDNEELQPKKSKFF